MKSKTVFDALSDFQVANPKANKLVVRSVIHRFLAECWGGQAPQGGKATFEEVAAFTEFIKTLPASTLIGTMEVLEQQFIQRNINKENSKSYRSAYKAFFNWVQSNSYFKKVEKKDNVQSSLEKLSNNLKEKKSTRTFKKHGLTRKQTYALMAGIYPSDYINTNLAQELELFEKFRVENHNCSKRTIEKDVAAIYRFLGWLHRYKDAPLENLSLTSIIHFIKLNVSINKFKDEQGKVNYQEFTLEKAIVRQEAVDLANENRGLIKEYLDFSGGHPRSKLMVIITCIAIVKFVFRNEIGTDEYIDDSDLPIVRRLNQLSTILNKTAKNTPPAIPHEVKSVSFNEAFDVLTLLRLIVHDSYNVQNQDNEVNPTKKHLKNPTFFIDSLQDFLSLAFMVLIPTDRARTYYELEIGRTFVYGLRKENRFIPADKLEDKSQAKWYIHLLPGDYKTGKIYKEYWGIMPDVTFNNDNRNDSNLYFYIALWLFVARELHQKCSHNYFFIGSRTHQPLNVQGWNHRIKNIFLKHTGVPVTPKEIRKMYITHINNQGATNAELKSAATAMHHSQKMQESNYNCQTALERIAPVMELNERMGKEAFGSSDPE